MARCANIRAKAKGEKRKNKTEDNVKIATFENWGKKEGLNDN
jgi:hypothetical protein